MTESCGFMRRANSRLYFADRCEFGKMSLRARYIILLECTVVLWFYSAT